MTVNQKKIGYARVSTDDQNLDLQRDALTKAGCTEIYEEIRALLKDPDVRVTDVAKRYGVSRATVYKHVGSVVPD